MTNDPFVRAEEIFHAASDLAASERTAYVVRACGGDVELRRIVDRLLARDSAPHALDGAPIALAPDLAGLVPDRIGRYRVLRMLGEGGMGQVYEAEQLEPRRTVAIKVLRPTYASAELISRFRREGQVLGALHHPGIAQVYEAGTAPLVVSDTVVAEVPFLAMELVRGEPLDVAVRSRGLDERAILELFLKICDAVHHAHAAGVVHRDLKPSNILVVDGGTTSHAGSEQPHVLAPKVLDFGVARLVQPGVESSIATRTGEVLGTLAYMSPEQARGDTNAVDARADVWALGVLLYEMLGKQRPFRLDGLPLHAAARVIEDGEPTRLATLDTRWRGDLDTIVAKCLEKDRERRYATTADLAGDVRRHLAHQPIHARPPSALYLVAKYARRHRMLVAAVAATLVALVGGLSYGLVRARAERDEAVAATDFLGKLLETPDANFGDKDLTVRQAITRLEPALAAHFAVKPALEARMRRLFARAFDQADDFERANALYVEALRLDESAFGPEGASTLKTAAYLAQTEMMLGRYDDAEARLRRVLAVQDRVLSPEDPETLLTAEFLADLYQRQGRAQESIAAFSDLLARCERAPDVDDARRAQFASTYAGALMGMQRYAEAEPIYRDALATLERALGPDHQSTISTRHGLAVLLSDTDRIDEALAEEHVALDAARRSFGPRSVLVASCLGHLAALEGQRGNLDLAERLLTEHVASVDAAFGRRTIEAAASRNNLAGVHRAKKRPDLAEPIYREILANAGRDLGAESWVRWIYQAQLGSTLLELKRPLEAEPLLIEAHANLERILGAADERTSSVARAVAGSMRMQGRAEEDEQWKARAGQVR